jgi:hypothetical protein
MSPYQHLFTSLREIPPQPINAANKTVFHATAVGDMRITIPNGDKMTYLTLKIVWYCTDLAFMLISINRCDLAGYSALFKGQKCTIRDPHGMLVGQIPLSDGLYKVQQKLHTPENANTTCATLTLNELHC